MCSYTRVSIRTSNEILYNHPQALLVGFDFVRAHATSIVRLFDAGHNIFDRVLQVLEHQVKVVVLRRVDDFVTVAIKMEYVRACACVCVRVCVRVCARVIANVSDTAMLKSRLKATLLRPS